MKDFTFCILCWAAMVLYLLGDRAIERAARVDGEETSRVGCFMISAAFCALAVLGLYALLKIAGRA